MATITDPRSKVTTNTYDIYGRLELTEDAESRVTQFTYDTSNRLTSVIDANSVTAEQRTYTDDGKLYQLTDARSNVSTYTYDGHDRKKRCTYPDSSYEEWTYDAAGNVTLFRSRSGDTITSTFDALNRLATRTPQGQATETFTYDLAGRLLSASTPTVSGNPATGTFSRGYDSAKRLTSETNPQSQVVSYQLDANGNVTKITYPDSYYVDKVYDQLDRLTNIKLNGSSSSAATFTYDDLSRRTNLTYLNGVDQDYGYDIGDNLTSMDLAWTGSSASWTYGYNDVDEMTSQAFSDTGFQWRPAAAATTTYGTANNLNQYPTVGGVTRTMNSDGCLTGDGTWTYTYDADNMLTQAAKTGVTVDFVYDPFHRNIRKDDGTNKTRYIYAGDQILCEYNDTSGALINRHVYGFEADDPIIQVTSGGTVTYNTQDHIGSIVARTDSSGNILSKYKYAPFGESPSLTGTIFGFTGQRFDAETGLYHFKARYYDPVTGRFLQPDSIGYGAGLNLYRYAANNPLGYTDPTGKDHEIVKRSSEFPKYRYKTPMLEGDYSAPGYWTNLRSSGISEIEANKKKGGPIYAQKQWVWETRTPSMPGGDGQPGLYDYKHRLRPGTSMEIQQKAAVEGNINFGYFGASQGYSLDVLKQGAGVVQAGGDYATRAKAGIENKDFSKLIPSEKLKQNIRLYGGDNDPFDQLAIENGFREWHRSHPKP